MAASRLNAPGIYVIRNIINGRSYVGSAVLIQRRWHAHKVRLRSNQHHSPFLQASWNKHGENAFVFEVIEFVMVPDLLSREQFWIDHLHAHIGDGGLNAAKFAGAASRGTKHTEEHKRKIGDAQRGRRMTEEQKAKISAANRGKPRTAEFKERMRIKSTGRRHTAESLEKLRVANTGKKMSPDAIARTAAFWRGRKHSPETLAKFKVSFQGRKVSAESTEKRRATMAGRPGKPHTPETIAKLKVAARLRPERERDPTTGRYL